MRAFFLLGILLLLGGCSSSYDTRVYSFIGAAPPAAGSYVLASGLSMAAGSDEAPFFRVMHTLDAMFARRGYTQAPDLEQADYLVYVEYGISDPLVRTRISNAAPEKIVAFDTRRIFTRDDKGKPGVVRQSRPVYGVTGYKERRSSSTAYITHLKVLMFPRTVFSRMPRNKGEVPAVPPSGAVWMGYAEYRGSSPDLGENVPVLAEALSGYLGQPVWAGVRLRLEERDDGTYVKKLL